MNRTSDYIRRDKVINTIAGIATSMSVCLNIDECHGMKKMQRKAVMEIANMTPEDVQPVVRCGKCKYGAPNGVYGCRLERFSYLDDSVRMYGEDFCSKGKREGEDND